MSQLSLYQQIDALSAEVITLLAKDDFERVNEKLALRLSLMQGLAEGVLARGDDEEQEQLRQFLLQCQNDDNLQVEQLLEERTKVLADSQKQAKIKQAVNAYQQFSNK